MISWRYLCVSDLIARLSHQMRDQNHDTAYYALAHNWICVGRVAIFSTSSRQFRNATGSRRYKDHIQKFNIQACLKLCTFYTFIGFRMRKQYPYLTLKNLSYFSSISSAINYTKLIYNAFFLKFLCYISYTRFAFKVQFLLFYLHF